MTYYLKLLAIIFITTVFKKCVMNSDILSLKFDIYIINS